MPKQTNVNQAAAFGLILFLSACGGGEEEKPTSPVSSALSAPIIWQSEPLKENLGALSVTDQGEPQFLVGYESGGLELVSFDGVSLTEPGPYRTTSLGNGTLVDVDGAELFLFPGISRSGSEIVVFVYSPGLPAPLEIELEADVSGTIEGICASASTSSPDTVNVGYWTDLDSQSLSVGTIKSEGENLIYEPSESLRFDKYVKSCAMVGDTKIAAGGFGISIHGDGEPVLMSLSGVPVHMTGLLQDDALRLAMSYSGGEVYVANEEGKYAKLDIQASLSSEAPDEVKNIVMSGLSTEASFPNGFLAIEGRADGGDSRILYLDQNDIFSQLDAAN
ncbi:MAG: hypothetical protein CMK07_09015 [Ponticaulis sp.]|nr:hypothetical protein [Ponticaulis sp.]